MIDSRPPLAAVPGARAFIRRVMPDDALALQAFYAGLSADSSHARFLGTAAEVPSGLTRSFCTPDHDHRAGFVAVTVSGEPRVVGHLCLEPAGGDRFELALAVADAEQGRGIGRQLFAAALRWAAEHGASAVVASCMADNSRVLRLLNSAPYPVVMLPASEGTVEVVMLLRGALPRPH